LHHTNACPQSLIINSFGLSTCEKRGDECSNYCKNGPTGSQYVWMLCTWRKRGEEDEEEEDR